MSRSELPTVTWHSSRQPRCETRSHYPIYIRSWVGYGDLQIFFRCLCEFRFASDPPQQALSAADNVKSDKQPGKYSVVYIYIHFLGRKADVLSPYIAELSRSTPCSGAGILADLIKFLFFCNLSRSISKVGGFCTLVHYFFCVAVEDYYDWWRQQWLTFWKRTDWRFLICQSHKGFRLTYL